MALQDLTQLEIFEGIFGLVWVLIAIIVGLRIILKAVSLKRKELITVGLTYIFACSAWWGVAFQFISYGFFDFKLDTLSYLFVANVFIPIGLVCWVYSFCDIMNPNLKKKFLIVITLICFCWEIFLIYFLFINIEIVGVLEGVFDSKHTIFSLIFIIFAILTFLITGVIFSLKSMKIDDIAIKWKGRFLLIAWISFTVGAVLDAAIALTEITLIIVRLILILSAIEYYLGFFLPKGFAEKLKNKSESSK
ncbi:MAG: hypothetical protein ACTSRI_04165 [Promethearchaeota archaeon]